MLLPTPFLKFWLKMSNEIKSSNSYTFYLRDADEDFDDDGFTNEEEVAYGSDPEDKESIPNSVPTNITGILSIAENAESGTVVGPYQLLTPDNHNSYSYSLISRTGGANARLWLDANDSNSIFTKRWKDLRLPGLKWPS